jgi:ELWxxDGT repeat protein
MKQKLLSTSVCQRLIRRMEMYIGLYILIHILSVAAYSQPVMLSKISDASRNFVSINSRLYFSSGDSLFTATSTSPAAFVFKTGEPIIGIYNTTVGGSFFLVTQSGAQQKLWRSDGTAANTTAITTQNQIRPVLTFNSQLFLRVASSTYGVEIWKVDAMYNATLLKDIKPGTGSGLTGDPIVHNNQLYFFADAGSGVDLWRSNGTTAGTTLAVDLDNTFYYQASGFYQLVSVNDVMFFTRYYEEGEYGGLSADLWKSDGSQTNTVLVKKFPEGNSYNFLSHFTSFEGKLYFFHNEGDPIYTYFSVSDGTAAGTTHLERTTIDGGPSVMIDAETHLLFYAKSQGYTTPIEKSDGGAGSVVHSFSLYHTEQPDQISLTATEGRAFFVDDVDDIYGGRQSSELWQADLVSGSTQTVRDIHGVELSGAGDIVAANGSVFFTRTFQGQTSLWHYDPSAPPGSVACAGNGSIDYEKWMGIPGYAVSSIPVESEGDITSTLTNFSAPANSGDEYGARIRGYVCVPQDGKYVFYISSDDNSELWLSTDEDPVNKRLIASSKWTNPNQWNKYGTQQSAEITLVKGSRYYIEALHKEAAGADHLSVGWKLPNGTLERPIGGVHLIPFNRIVAPTLTFTSPVGGALYTTPATVDIGVQAQDADGTVAKVEFYVAGVLIGQDLTAPYTYQWTNVPEGDYRIEARATDNEGFFRSEFLYIRVLPPSCPGTGNIYQEIWAEVAGSDVRNFNFTVSPNGGYRTFTSFETPQYYANNYASRMRARLCVPMSGAYTFWISSDDYSELYLSTDDTEGNKKLIAWVYGSTPYRNYDKYASQKSALITLAAGQSYYIEARHKEGSGNDFVSVGWQLPNGTLERPIAGSNLVPIPPSQNEAPEITITSPTANEEFTAPASVWIAADVTDVEGVREVHFYVQSGTTVTRIASFTSPPYEFQWNNVPAGSYQLTVYADDVRGQGTIRVTDFTVVGGTSCAGTGTIVREIWRNIPGTSIASIPVNSAPSNTVTLTSLSTPNYYANDYGSRIRGYICAPESGAYTFWISGDDNSELWLSSSDAPSAKTRIAYASLATSVNQWSKYATQKSASINLVQGQRYYIEILHKEANGADHVEVGWQLPTGSFERPIAGSRLIPFTDSSTSAAMFSSEGVFEMEQADILSVYPNPVVSGTQISISLPGGIPQQVDVDIISLTGVSVQRENTFSAGEDLTINLKNTITPGMYLVKVSGDNKHWATKVQIK